MSIVARILAALGHPSSEPVVNAGPDQTVLTGAIVTLDGSASTGTDPLRYQWLIKSRSPFSLSDPGAVNPTFVSHAPGFFVFELRVSDANGNFDRVIVHVAAIDPLLRTARELIFDLGATGALSRSRAKGLHDILKEVGRLLAHGKQEAAVQRLHDFEDRVARFLEEGPLMEADVATILSIVADILEALEAPAGKNAVFADNDIALNQASLAGLDPELPDEFALEDNYPNPFNSETVIPFAVPQDAHVRIAVFDMLGREMAVLINDDRGAGRHEVHWQAENVATGIYLVRMQSGPFVHVRKVILSR